MTPHIVYELKKIPAAILNIKDQSSVQDAINKLTEIQQWCEAEKQSIAQAFQFEYGEFVNEEEAPVTESIEEVSGEQST